MASDFVLGPKPEDVSMDTTRQGRAPLPATTLTANVAAVAGPLLGVPQVNEVAVATPVQAAQIAALHGEPVTIPDCQQAVEKVATILNDPTPPPTPPTAPRIGTLVINEQAPTPPPPPLAPSSLERLHKAALYNDRNDFKKAVLALSKEQASRVIQELLLSLKERKDFIHYCFVYSEVIQLLPHFSAATYGSRPVTAGDIAQDEPLQVLISQLQFGRDASEVQPLKSSLKEGFVFLLQDKELQGHIGELLDAWAEAGNSAFYLEALRELKALYSPEEFKKVIGDSISTLLSVKSEIVEEYCALLKEIGTIIPDFYVLEDKDGLLRIPALRLVIEQLQTEGVLSSDTPDKVCTSLFSGKEGVEAKKMVKKLLQEVARRADPLLYSFVLHELARVFPQIPTVVDPVGTLTPKGIRAVLDHLQAKGSIAKEFSCFVCENVLPDGVTTIQKKVEEAHCTRFSIIVRHPGASHVTPILLEKVDGKWRALVTDSVGTGNSTYSSTIELMLKVAIPDVMIYPFKVRRQSAPVGCPIFAILDVAQFSKTPDIMKFAMAHVSEKKQEVTELPPKMMRPTQSLNRLMEYIGEEGSGEEGKAKMGEKRAVIEESLMKHVVEVLTSKGKKDINGLALHRFNKYSQMLVSDVVMNVVEAKRQAAVAIKAFWNEEEQPDRKEDAAAQKTALDAVMNEGD